MKQINNPNQEKYFEIDQKALQIRWTDIEIRKYRLNNIETSNMEFEEEDHEKADK